MLQSTLELQGHDLSFTSNTLPIISLVSSLHRVGVGNITPTETLTVSGSIGTTSIVIGGDSATISARNATDLYVGAGENLHLGNVSSVKLLGGSAQGVVITDGSGNLSFARVSDLLALSGLRGNTIPLGSNLQGQLVSNAVALTSSTQVTDGIALMNQVLGKLVPPQPPVFPASQTLSVLGTVAPGRMTNFVQTDHTPAADKNLVPGSLVTSVLRVPSYTTSTIVNSGPGNLGLIEANVNGVRTGSVTLTGSSDGSYGELTISNNQDYNQVLSSIPVGFWSVFSARAAGTVAAGWNQVRLADQGTLTQTNTASWYYDSAQPGVPTFSNVSVINTANLVSYSSTVPHYTSSTQFNLKFNISKLSGDLYPVTDTFITGQAGGAFATPASITYATAGVTTPLARNLYVSSGSAAVSVPVNIIGGFGSSSAGPTVSVDNSYSTGSSVFSPSSLVLYKTGITNNIEETSIPVSVGIGSGTAARVVINSGAVDTPVISAGALPFNSQSSTLGTIDATVVAAVLRHDQTNYSVGYLPAGPDLSQGRSAAQYFTLKFTRSAVSKFNILYTGTIAGMWVSVPDSQLDSTSGINGWLDTSVPYAGTGVPGTNTGSGGNGSNGAALGGVAVLGSVVTAQAVTVTFGTVSSSSTPSNEIYVRIKLTAGQSVSALSIGAATN
jgi:hypothetical protein